ncbi:cilia- and flagella-associated protein 157 [Belonocnema kinseyi]|uniref:cilia- and flagella-associated protein 157 n=1 Tax=Belonocnema kinseyi TaxID=2817044 RepID=UPI00143CD848|nr:cilia- and flagella-associated protein 157 [Belonocnema kinseyi]
MPKKKKKGVEKEKKTKKKFFVNERETLSFEQQILDNNRQLARLRSRNADLETEMENLKQKYYQLEEDRADVVAHLKRVLNEKTSEAKELHEQLLALDEIRKEEQLAFKKKEESMEQEFRVMESNLSAQVKLAEGKLNSLEEWRLARLDLMKKFEEQEKQMAEQEKRHKETLYNAEKELILGKAKMQKEVEERLIELAQSFRDATTIRIADATHRAIQENISLNRELDAMFRTCRELDSKSKEYKERDRILRLQGSLYKTEAKMALRKVLKQNQIINKLSEDHVTMNQAYGKLQRAEELARRNESLMEKCRQNSEEMLRKIRILEQHIQKTKENEKEIMEEVCGNHKEIENLEEILKRARNCIEEALELQAEVPDEDVCTSCYSEVKEKLLHSLLDILGHYRASKVSSSQSSLQYPRIASVPSRYKPGSLGLIPISESQKNVRDDSNEDKKKTIEKEEPEEKVPDCLISDTRSSVSSPVETELDFNQSV